MKLIKKLWEAMQREHLLRDNLTLFIGGSIVNGANFLYHFFMGRILGPAEYSVLGAVIAIIHIFAVPLYTIQSTIAKFTADYKSSNKEAKVASLYSKSLKKVIKLGMLAAVIFMFLSPLIAKFLHISSFTVLLMTPILISLVILPVNRGLLQGLQYFSALGKNYAGEGIVKLGISLLLVWLGFAVNGAIIGIFLSFAIPFWITHHYIKKKLVRHNNEELGAPTIYRFFVPTFIALLGLTALNNIDILLVKHFFSEEISGLYVAIAILGRIIFYASLTISQVMIPKVASLTAENKSPSLIFKKSFIYTALLSICAIIAYNLLPSLIVLILFGKKYISIAPYLGTFAIALTMFSLSYLTALYQLTLGNTKGVYIILAMLPVEALGIYFYHSTLQEVITVVIITMALLFLGLLLTQRKNHHLKPSEIPVPI